MYIRTVKIKAFFLLKLNYTFRRVPIFKHPLDLHLKPLRSETGIL